MTSLPYIRVRGDYYKRIQNQDVAGWPYDDLIKWERQTIIDDHKKEALQDIPKYDTFTNIPDNGITEIEVLPNLYNLYKPLQHDPQPGEWLWTETLIRHVFGDQYELGLDYIQLLYEQPLQILPILCLVSKENATGKTTFLNWLRMIFNSNMITVGNQDIHGRFNSHYAHKLIISVDESRIDKDASQEKIKAMATQKTINYEGKFQNAYTIPFFGKLILCSNYEDNFINAKEDDIRYWIRKLPPPQRVNVNIEDDLLKEVPAFLFDLRGRRMFSQKKSRMWFAPEDIETEALNNVRYQSRSWMYKELEEVITSHFLQNESLKEFYADPTDIKERWFNHNNSAQIAYIRRVLKSEFDMDSAMVRYKPLGDESNPLTKSGRAFKFIRDNWIPNQEPELAICNNEKDDGMPF